MKKYLLSVLVITIFWISCGVNTNAQSIFDCNFEKSTCGLFNDEGHEAKWQTQRMDLGNRTGTVMVVKAGDAKKKQIARLVSPIFYGYWGNAEGCLSLDVFTAGDGVTGFFVKQQDDSGVLPLLGVHTQITKWRKYTLHLDVGDFASFIFEAHVNPALGGTLVAIDNLSFTLEDCKD